MKTKYIGAGAGSGKTYRLTHDLADRLTEGDEPLDASHIILTTFTKAAAEDFKKKAREVLINEKHNPAKAAELDSALIGTVHSVCESFVKKYWYRLGITIPLNVMSDDEKTLYVSRTAENVVSDSDIKYFTDFARDYEMNADVWKDFLKSIVVLKMDFGVDGFKKSCETSCNDIASVFDKCATGKEDILNDFLYAIVTSLEARNRERKERGQKPELVGVQDEAKRLLNAPSLFKKATKVFEYATDGAGKTRGFWKDCFDAATYDKVIDAASCILLSDTVGTDLQKFVEKLFELAEAWEKEYQQFKDENGLVDFNDLEQKFIRILEDDEFEDIRQDIRDSYDLLMVDEFQDSNPVQIKIFRKLMELVEETVFVGDRKQAIFGFRGTESSLVEDFIKGIPEQNRDSLKESYRSRPELVEAANDTFCQAFKVKKEEVFPRDPTKPYDGVSLKPVRPAREDMEPALQFWLAPLKSERSKKKSDYFAIGKKISDIVESGKYLVVQGKDDDGNEIVEPLQFRDIALLFRFNSGIYDAAQAFREAGVPVSIQEKEFIGWAEAQLLLSLVRYVFNAGDLCAKADILHLVNGTPSDVIIADTATQNPVEKAQELFAHLEALRSRISVLSVSEIVEALTLELDLLGNTGKWGLSDTRARNIGFMTDLAKQYEQQCANLNASPTLPGYIAYVSNYKSKEHSVDKTNTVTLLSYHSAKGLEWPMVILDELDSLDITEQEIFKKDFSGVRPFREKGSDQVLLHVFPGMMSKKSAGGFTSQSSIPEPLIQRLKDSAFFDYVTKRKIEEERRLLYVGFTRARDYLVSLGNSKSLFSWPVLCNAGSFSDTGNPELVWHPKHPSTYSVLQAPEEEENEPGDRNLKAWKLPSEPAPNDKYISPSQAGSKKQAVGSPSIPVKFKEEPFHGERMVQNIQDDMNTLCGTCIHRIFAAFDPEGNRNEMAEMAGRIITGLGLTEEFPSPESVVDSAVQFFSWIRQTYGTGTPLHELPLVNRQSDGTVIRGDMDLVWELPDKKCVLVDYKSFHGSEELSGIKAHAVQHGYPAQLKAYKEMLEAGDYEVKDVLIYYFVLGKIIQLVY